MFILINMQSSRPQVYDNTTKARAKLITAVTPTAIKEARPAQPRALAEKKTPINLDIVNQNDDSDIIAFFRNQKPDFLYRGYYIKEITSTYVILENAKTKKTEKRLIKEFINQARLDIAFGKGQIRLDGKVVNRNDVINLIKQDIENRRPVKGKRIIDIFPDRNLVVVEGDNILGLTVTKSLDEFITEYITERKFGYGDSDTVVQDLNEQTRLQNIEDLTTAFKNALGIPPAKISHYKQTKTTRQISRVSPFVHNNGAKVGWSAEQLSNTYRTGKVPNAPIKVNGELHNIFMPDAPVMQAVYEVGANKYFGPYVSGTNN
jgi:hypothetical protein